MSDEKYRQVSKNRKNCTQGHWTGVPSGSSDKNGGCWLCKYGCAVLAYLKWKGEEPDKDNVTALLNSNADVIWSKMGLSESTTFESPCIGKLKSKQHYVYIKDENFNVFDPGNRNNKTMKKSDFSCYYCEEDN